MPRSPHDAAGQTLEIRDLSIAFPTPRGSARVVDHVSLSIGGGEIVGLIGESGSGKTLTALAVLGMTPRGARIESGSILLGGESLLDKTERERRALLRRRPNASWRAVLEAARVKAETQSAQVSA